MSCQIEKTGVLTQVSSHTSEDDEPKQVVEESDKVHNGDDDVHDGGENLKHNITVDKWKS